MSLSKEHEEFLVDMGILPERFKKLGRDAQVLVEIAEDYEIHKNDLLDEASYVANKLQRCEGVHTVRSRIKDTSHVIEKIIRKWECENVAEKYDTISKNTYKSIISDLIGVRAIYLFKKDWELVHTHILSRWEQQEPVVIYYRNGDDLTKYENYKDCATEEHDKGYRSIHYIIPATKIDGQQVKCEIQTRTIFEEGWSEIDHKVRYPSFSDNPYLQEFLDIFNRISGSADEMGSFVNSLRELIKLNVVLEESKKLTVQVHENEIRKYEEKIEKLFKEKAELQDIEAAYNSLKDAKAQKDQIEQEVAAFQKSSSQVPSGNKAKLFASALGLDLENREVIGGTDSYRKAIDSALGLDIETRKIIETALGLNAHKIVKAAFGPNSQQELASVLGIGTKKAMEATLGGDARKEMAASLGLKGIVDTHKQIDDDNDD
ncbi:hypothetical protein [Acinetobacter sp. CWB-B33]|uniref:RelA/SpoT domain-containing protein n=1 Tax=Acinetobacter sp. CWB-B33 TaxID=2815724 RepID=UPI0031FEFE81